MFDADEYRRRFLDTSDETLKKAYSKRTREFMFLKPKSLADGQYVIRFLPPMPEKCPEGYTRVATHRVPVTIGGDPKTVECIRTADEPCALCDMMRGVIPYNVDMDKAVAETFQAMDPWVRAVYPISIFAWPSNPADRQSLWVKTPEEHGAIFEVSAQTLIKDIFNLFLASGNKLNHAQKGYYCSLSKRHHQYELSLLKPEPLRNDNLIKSQVYPNIEKMMFESERYPVLRLSYKQQLAFLEDCWFIAEDPVSKVYSDVVNSHTRNNAAEQESSEDDILSMLN